MARPRRKHWWHASLRPSLTGLTTGVIHSNIDFEVELDLRESAISVHTSTGEQMREELRGQPAEELAVRVRDFLQSARVSAIPPVIASGNGASAEAGRLFPGYSAEEANKLARALSAVSAAMDGFRARYSRRDEPGTGLATSFRPVDDLATRTQRYLTRTRQTRSTPTSR